MKFSVLMSVYYKENYKYLQQSLESIVNQTCTPNEIVIVKDGKLTDELNNTIESFQRDYKNLFKIVELEENVGLGKALNIGVKNCRYQLIARMDTDDIARLDRFEKQLQIFNENNDIDIVGTCIDEYDDKMENRLSYRKVPETHREILTYSKKRNPFNHMTVMYKKTSVINAGNYKDFMWNEDYYLWIRMLKEGYKGYNIQEPLVLARTGEGMFERRGGYKYAIIDFKLQKELLKMGYTNIYQFIRNTIIRCSIRILPNSFRKNIYLKLLRK